MIPRLKPIKPVRRLGIVERAGERKEPPAIPKPVLPRVETNGAIPPSLTPVRAQLDYQLEIPMMFHPETSIIPQYGTPMDPRYATPVIPQPVTPMMPQPQTPMAPQLGTPMVPQRPGIYTPAPPLMPRELEISPPPREVITDGVAPTPREITPPEDVGVAPAPQRITPPEEIGIAREAKIPITQPVPIGVSVPLNRQFSTIHSMASTNVALAMSHTNRVWDMINKAEGEVRGILEAQGREIDPATRAALQELRRQGELERNRIIGWYNQRGLLRGNLLAQEINRFQQNILTAQERMLADMSTRSQERLHTTLMQFALQRANISQWEAELALRARQADIGEAQWEMARQDAMSKWTAEMNWDREKYYTTFKESARRFGIEQEKIDRAFGLEVRRVELAERGLTLEERRHMEDLQLRRDVLTSEERRELARLQEQARQFGLQHGLEVGRAELQREQFEFYKTNIVDQMRLNWAQLGLEEARVSNSATMAIRELSEQRRQFDLSLERDKEQFSRNLDLKLVEQGFTRRQVDLAKREFDLQIARNAESIRQFNEGMRLNWAQLATQREVQLAPQRRAGLKEPAEPTISPEVSRNLADFLIRQAQASAVDPDPTERARQLERQYNSLLVSQAQGLINPSDFARVLSVFRNLHVGGNGRRREAQLQLQQAKIDELRRATPPRTPQPRQAPPKAPQPVLPRRPARARRRASPQTPRLELHRRLVR